MTPRPRKMKALKDDLPPFRPLTKDEVIGLAKAGGIEFECLDERYDQFAAIVERARDGYENDLGMSKFSLTDWQIEERIMAVREAAAQLRGLLGDASIDWHARLLLPREGDPTGEGGISNAEIEKGLARIEVRSQLALSKLKVRAEQIRNEHAAPSATKWGLHELLMVLATAWRFGSSTPGFALPAGINSPVIPFFRKGMLMIAQLDVGIEAARKWVRVISREADS